MNINSAHINCVQLKIKNELVKQLNDMDSGIRRRRKRNSGYRSREANSARAYISLSDAIDLSRLSAVSSRRAACAFHLSGAPSRTSVCRPIYRIEKYCYKYEKSPPLPRSVPRIVCAKMCNRNAFNLYFQLTKYVNKTPFAGETTLCNSILMFYVFTNFEMFECGIAER